MKALVLLSLIIACYATTPLPPSFPEKHIASGTWYSFNTEGRLKGNGVYNIKYNWVDKVERSDTFIDPASQYHSEYMVVWKTDHNAILAFLDDNIGGINCTTVKNEDSKIHPPDILKDICTFSGLDTVGDVLAHKFDCKYKELTFTIWFNAHIPTPLKLEMQYSSGVRVIATVDQFHEVSHFDKDIFVPPRSWECPHL